jgi:hypothetical protein
MDASVYTTVPTGAIAPTAAVVKDIDGRQLNRCLRKGVGTAWRALLAHDLERGLSGFTT